MPIALAVAEGTKVATTICSLAWKSTDQPANPHAISRSRTLAGRQGPGPNRAGCRSPNPSRRIQTGSLPGASSPLARYSSWPDVGPCRPKHWLRYPLQGDQPARAVGRWPIGVTSRGWASTSCSAGTRLLRVRCCTRGGCRVWRRGSVAPSLVWRRRTPVAR